MPTSEQLADFYESRVNNTKVKFIPNYIERVINEDSNLENHSIISVGRLEKVKGFEDDSMVEMPLEIRFMKAGLEQDEAIKVAKDWSLLNKFRHRSEENTQSLHDILNKLGYTKKDYLKYVLNLFRELKLYDRD